MNAMIPPKAIIPSPRIRMISFASDFVPCFFSKIRPLNYKEKQDCPKTGMMPAVPFIAETALRFTVIGQSIKTTYLHLNGVEDRLP